MEKYILLVISVILLFIIILTLREKRKIIRKSIKSQIILTFLILIILILMHLFYENKESFTVSKILEIVFGRSAENDIIPEMTRLKNEGLLLNHYQKVRSFYSCSGEYV